ncbi:hypothetical protein F5Y19DRAFT_469080 [Xylariaceae sp. FL1651]|nr:hypothetical protein F5Y19DRAFT_469080 [Xylariaceae sp. FL1651]
MLSLSSLLNPAPSGPSTANRFPPSPVSSSPTDSCAEDSAFQSRPTMPKHKMPKDAAVFTKSKPKGAVNFPPFEKLDATSLRLVGRFQVYPFGKIQEFSRHIPYNSGKKDFYEKTGRESFEVFQYVFKVPGDDTEFTVMWDYNVGLVRMTPFFKCCKYPKTTPAKMLNSNPGLKEITHSITGGSIMAQGALVGFRHFEQTLINHNSEGYWMPYQCAKAVCATFCHNIAGALIPIFGPDFPSLCTPSEAPEYSRMIIDPAIVVQSTREADHFRRLYNNAVPLGSGSRNDNGNISPQRDHHTIRSPYDDNSRHHPRHRIRKTYITTPGSDNSPYATDTDGEISPVTDRGGIAREIPHLQLQRFLYSPVPSTIAPLRPSHTSGKSSGWTPANIPHPQAHPHPHAQYQSHGPSPWLSAIPRFTTTAHLQPSSHHYSSLHPLSHSYSHSYLPGITHNQLPSPAHAPPHSFPPVQQSSRKKRPAEDGGPDHQHNITLRQSQSQRQIHNHQSHADKESYTEARAPRSSDEDKPNGSGGVGADKKAALLLMNLSVRDRSFWKSVGKCQTPEDIGFSGLHNISSYGNSYTKSRTIGNLDDDGRTHYHKTGGGATSTAKTSVGVTSESMSPVHGAFPRIKRVRSNSM